MLRVGITLILLFNAASAASGAPRLTARDKAAPVRAADTIECEVLDQVFTQETANGARPSPGLIGMLAYPDHSAALVAEFIPPATASLGVPGNAARELRSAARASQNAAWKPNCSWSMPPTGMVNAFSRPILTEDRRLAAFQWDAGIDDPPRDSGKVCVAYKPERTWQITCAVARER